MRGSNHSNKQISPDENPYLNEKIYPATIVLTSSIMDAYLGSQFIPGKTSLLYEPNPSIQSRYDELRNELQVIGDLFKPLVNSLNDNKLDGMKKMYKLFCSEYDKSFPSQSKKYEKEIPSDLNSDLSSLIHNTLDTMETNRHHRRKELFIEALHLHFYDPIKESLEEFNKNSKGSFLLFDICEMVAVHRTRGVITKRSSQLNDQEIALIRSNTQFAFNTLTHDIKMPNIDIIFIEYMHLMAGFKNVPFGILFTDKIDPKDPYKNKNHMREI